MMNVAPRPSMEPTPPAGFFDAAAASMQPEKRLMLAVLEDAVTDFQAYATLPSGRGRRIFVEAEAWFQSTATDHVFDFERICQALELDPSFIRGGLGRWCAARRRQSERTVIRFPFHRVSGTRHTIAVAS